jgi:hypothetical protein
MKTAIRGSLRCLQDQAVFRRGCDTHRQARVRGDGHPTPRAYTCITTDTEQWLTPDVFSFYGERERAAVAWEEGVWMWGAEHVAHPLLDREMILLRGGG